MKQIRSWKNMICEALQKQKRRPQTELLGDPRIVDDIDEWDAILESEPWEPRVLQLPPMNPNNPRAEAVQELLHWTLPHDADQGLLLDTAIAALNARPLGDGTYVFQGMGKRCWWQLDVQEMLVVGNEHGYIPVFNGILPRRMPQGWTPYITS